MSVAIVDSFKKIKLLPDGTELIADKTSDTLTLKAGTGVNFLVSADGTSGTNPGQGPIVEIYNTGQGLAVLNDVLKLGNVSNQAMTVGSATIDSLLIDNSQLAQTDNTKDLVWRTQTSSYTLAPSTTTPPTPSGVGPYSVQFPIPTQGSAPVTSVWYFVADNSNPNYNGLFKATASTTSSLTLEYPTNPGTFGLQVTSLTANGSVVQINFAAQPTIPFTPYVDNAGDYVTVSGFTGGGSNYHGSYPVKAAGLTYVTFDSGTSQPISSGYGVVTKPTTAATANGTNNTIALTNNLIIGSTQGIKIPIGTSAQRPAGPLPLTGFIRYNTDLGSFEGYVGSAGWNSLGGVRSVDGYTYISAESSAGSSDDTLRLYTSTNAPGSFLSLTVDQTNTKILTKGLVIPTGTTAERPASPITGMIRFNSTDSTFEGYQGAQWSSLGGVRSVDGLTYISAESSSGASDDMLRFYTSTNPGSFLALTIDQNNTTVNTKGFVLPVGDNSAGRPATPLVGMIRYNSTDAVFEGYSNSSWSSLGGVRSVDGLTYISAEASAAASDDILRFYASTNISTISWSYTGSPNVTVTVNYTGHGLSVGQTIVVSGATTTGVNPPNGTYTVSAIGFTANSFQYIATGLSTTGTAGGTILITSLAQTIDKNNATHNTNVIIANEKSLSLKENSVSGTRTVSIKAPTLIDTTGGSYTLTLPTKLGTAGNLLSLNNATGTLEFVSGDSFGGYRISVLSTSSDSYDGVNKPVKTIKRALQLASALVYTASNTFNADYCFRDTGLIIDAIGWDLAYGGNWQSVKAGLAYQSKSANTVLASQKAITVSALQQLQIKAVASVAAGDSSLVNARAQTVIDIVNGSTASTGLDIGTGIVPAISMPDPAGLAAAYSTGKTALLANNTFAVAFFRSEATAYLTQYYNFNVTGTSSTGNLITVGAGSYQTTTANMYNGMPIKFSATQGGITSGLTYYVLNIASGTTFTITATAGSGTAVTLSTSGTMTASLSYDSTKNAQDVESIIYAVTYDIIYGGNSETVYAGLKYFDALGTATTSQIPDGQASAIAVMLARISTVAQQVAQNITVTKSTGNSATQTVGSANTNSGLATAIASNFTTIINIVNNGASVAPTVVYPTASYTAGRAALINNKTVIQTYVVASAANYKPNGIKVVVNVGNGDYIEDNPIIVPDNVSVLGAGLRSAIIRPLNANKDVLRVRNGSYFGEFTFRDHLNATTTVPDWTFNYAVAFDDVDDWNDLSGTALTRVGYTLPITKPVISVSPYVQNCSIVSFLGGNGALVDGNKVASPNIPTNQIEVENPVSGPAPEQGKSMVANAFTMLSFGGTGWRVVNDAYAQIVSCFQIFMLHGSYTLSGGYLSITNSATNFGLYALRSGGYSPNAFQADKGYVVSTGQITGGIQTITAIGFGRVPTVHYITRFRTPDYKIAYDLLKADKAVIQDAVINAAGTSGYTFTYFTTSVTNNNSGTWTCTSTANFTVGEKVEFTGTTFGGVSAGTAYYIKTIPNATTFTLSTTSDILLTFAGSSGSGNMVMKFFHNTIKSNRDIGYVVDAVAYDLYTGGNSQSVLAGLSYWNGSTLTSTGLNGEITQCIAMLSVAKGLARTYVATELSANAALLGGYGLVISWTSGTAGTLPVVGSITILSATFTSTISGNVLTITTLASGTIAVGMALSGGSVTSGTFIVGTNGVGTGNNSTWILNQAATGTPTTAGSTGFSAGDVVTVWAGNSNGTLTVGTVTSGAVTSFSGVSSAGTNYASVGTKVTASNSRSLVGRFDIVNSILANSSVAPTSIAYSAVSDISSNYLPSTTTYSFSGAAVSGGNGVDIAANTITWPYTGLIVASGSILIYNNTTGASNIGGLDVGQAYYVGGYTNNSPSGSSTFALYYDPDRKFAVDLISLSSGNHQFIYGSKDFYVSSIVSYHNSYQTLTIGGAPSVTSFAPGQLLSGSSSNASGYVYSWNHVSKALIVSLNDILYGGVTIKQQFNTADTLTTSSYPVSSAVPLSSLYTGTFTVAYSDATILALNNTGSGGYPSGMYNNSPSLVTGGSGAVSSEIWLHRPSIVNSSGHTWEYAGSGTDYNALPQNGGASDFSKEQWSDSPGRTYSSGTNELGDFKVGKFITAENRTGNVSFTNTVTVNSLSVLKLALGSITISEISNDQDLGDNEQGGATDSRLSTQLAIKSYFKNHLGPFIDKGLSTNAVPNAIPQLNSQGQIDISQIPAIRTFNSFQSEGYNSRINLSEEIPANDVLNGDIATETYSTAQLTLNANITANKGDLVVQATSNARGYLVSDVSASAVITVASDAKTFSYIVNGIVTARPFLTGASNTLTVGGTATGTYPTAVGAIASGIQTNYVLSNALASEYLLLDPTATHTFTSINVGSTYTLVTDTIYLITSLGSGVNWASIASGPTFTNPATGATTATPTLNYYFTYNGTTPTHTTTAGIVDIYQIISANEKYTAVLAGTLGNTSYRKGVVTNATLAGGTGYLPATGTTLYLSVALTGGSGSGATADITVTNGIVVNVDLRRGGINYVNSNVLSASNTSLGGAGSGFTYTVSSIEKRLYVNISGGSKITATSVANNYTQDNSAVIKSVVTNTTTTLTFNNGNTTGGGNVNVTNNSFDITGHGFSNGDPVRLTSLAFGGLTTNTITYYIFYINANSFRLYQNYNLGSVFTISSSGAGGAASGTFVRYNLEIVDNRIYLPAHGYNTGDAVKITGTSLPGYSTDGTTQAGTISTNTFWFVGSVNTNSFTIHATQQNAKSSVNGIVIGGLDLFGTPPTATMYITKQNVALQGIINTSSVATANWSNLTTNNVDAGNIISGTVSTSRLGSGTANSSTFLRGDSSWQYAVQGLKETVTPLTISGSSYLQAATSTFTGQIHGPQYINASANPSKSGSGPYYVVYTFGAVLVAPAIGVNYIVSGATTTAYNGLTLNATASSTTSITIAYPIDPGTWNSATTTYITLASGNILYVSAVATGTIAVGMVLSVGSGSPYIVSQASTNTGGYGVAGGTSSTWTISSNQNVASGSITGSSNDNIFYGAVGLDVERVDGSQNLTLAVTGYTNLGVASFNKNQFYVGQLSTYDLGQVTVKDGVIDAGKLNGQLSTYYTNPANLTAAVGSDKGGTGFGAYSVGDILYASAISGSTALSKLNIGTSNQILTSSGTIPQWSSDLSVPGNVTISGNLTVNGISSTVNSSTIAVDDKNIELASVVAVIGLQASLSLLTAIVTLTNSTTTKGLIPGMAVTVSTGSGVFGTTPRILSVDSLTQITLTVNHATAGPVTFDAGGATDFTADGGGITLKGASDKTIIWDQANTNWTSSENWNIANTKTFKINNSTVLSSTQVLGKTPGGTSAGDIVTIDATQVLTNKTLRDGTTSFQDSTNILKQFKFNVASIGGNGATFTVTANGSGVVTGLTLLSGGKDYLATDVITLEGPGTPTTKVIITVVTVASGGVIATFSNSTLSLSTGYTVGTGTGTTAISTTIANRTMIVPGGSTTLVGTDSYQNLTNKAITGGTVVQLTKLSIRDTSAAYDVIIAGTSSTALTADRTLTLDMVNAARTIKLAGSIDIANNFSTSGGFAVTLTATAATNVTLPTTGTLVTQAATQPLSNKTLDVATTTFKDLTANIPAKFSLSAGTGLTLGGLHVVNGVVQQTPLPTITAAGTGYVVNDYIYLNGNPTAPTAPAKYIVQSVNSAGGVTGLAWNSGGTGYTPNSGSTNPPNTATFATTASTVDSEVSTRSYTFPATDGVDILVSQDAAQTLTNKTLTTPTIGTSMIVPIIYGSSLASGQLKLRSTSDTTKPTAGVLVDDNITSTSTTTGSLVVTGGVGISENLWSGSSGYFATSVKTPLLTTNNSGINLVLSTNNSSVFSGTITINSGAGGNINITPNGIGSVNLGDTTTSGILTTGAAAANLTLNTNSGTNSGTIIITAGANGNITLTPNGTGTVSIPTVNKVTITAPATGSTLTIADGKTLTASNTLTFTGTDSSSIAFGTGGTVTYTTSKLSAFSATTSAELAGVISDETGTGKLVFDTSPSFTTDIRTPKVTTATAVNLVLETNLGTNTGSITINTGANGNIEIAPNGTGDVYLTADSVRIGDSNTAATLTTNGTGNLTLNTNGGTSSGSIVITTGVNGNIAVTPNGTGSVNLGDTTTSGVLTTGAAAANLTLNTNGGTNSGSIVITAGASADIVALANGTGNVKLNTLNINNSGAVTVGTWQGSLVAGTYGGTGVNNGTKTITLGGNLTTTGAFNTSFTQSASVTLTLPNANSTLATTGDLSQFASTTSAQLRTLISDETGTGVLVFGTSPTFTTDITTTLINGGSTASANLTLRSTTNATKGQVVIDEATASTTSTSGALKVTGGVGVSGNIYTAGRVGFTATAGGASAVYQVYNSGTASLDTIFG